MIDVELPVIEFSSEDRCDRCGAQAYAVAMKEGSADLLFCVHHRRANYDVLLDKGWTVIDDVAGLERLYPTLPTSV